MKKNLLGGFLLLVFMSVYFSARASHCAGGEIQYRWVSDSTYHITFKLYRDCQGNTAPSTVQLCYKNSCDNVSRTTTLSPVATLPGGVANGSSVSTGCGGYPNACQSATSTLPGYAEWWYEQNVTLPFRCSDWTFSVSISARNVSTNLNGGSNNLFYVEATLNNIIAQGNSSPEFTVKPVPFVCINNPYTYNNGVAEINGDSLGYVIINPEKGDCTNGVTNIPFASTIYNLTNNPIATNNTFSLDPVTGQMSFTPALLGASTLTLRVNEYRNKVLIGSSMRDIQVRTSNCTSVQPVITVDSASLQGTNLANGRIESCANKQLNFCFKVKVSGHSAILVASDNHAGVAPGSTMTYTGQTTDSIFGCFSWIPTPADTGLKIFTVIVKDSTCLPPGIAVSQSYVLPIFIYPVTKIYRDTTICIGNSVPLKVSGGNTFIWSVLPGGSPASSLSCTNCTSPTVTPTITTRYVVVSDLISICNKSRDTVTVTVKNPPTLPPASSNGPVCRGATLKLFAGLAATSYEWTGPAGFKSTLQNPVIANVQLPNAGAYQLIAKNGTCASPTATVTVVVNPAPSVPVLTGSTPACEGQDLVIHATGSGSGVSYYWEGPNGYTNVTLGDLVIPNAGPQHAGAFTVKAGYPTNVCQSGTTNYLVTLNPKVTADFDLSRNIVCQDDTVTVTFSGSGANMDSLMWSFPNGVGQSSANTGEYIVHFTKSGEQIIRLIASNNGCIDSAKKAVTILPKPSSEFSVNKDACIDDVLEITADVTVAHNLDYDWDFQGAVTLDGEGRGRYHIKFATPGYKSISFRTFDGSCPSTTTTTVFVHPYPTTHILSASKLNVCTSDTVRLNAHQEQGYTYHWSPELFFAGNDQPVTEAYVHATGYVQLTASDSYGCKGHDSIFINTTPCCEVSLPNAFTPNGDGRNDIFRIITIGYHSIKEFRVLNRWGQSVFGTFNEKEGWDGTLAGQQQEMGTYFYYVRYRCSNGQIFEQKGELLLIR